MPKKVEFVGVVLGRFEDAPAGIHQYRVYCQCANRALAFCKTIALTNDEAATHVRNEAEGKVTFFRQGFWNPAMLLYEVDNMDRLLFTAESAPPVFTEHHYRCLMRNKGCSEDGSGYFRFCAARTGGTAADAMLASLALGDRR